MGYVRGIQSGQDNPNQCVTYKKNKNKKHPQINVYASYTTKKIAPIGIAAQTLVI